MDFRGLCEGLVNLAFFVAIQQYMNLLLLPRQIHVARPFVNAKFALFYGVITRSPRKRRRHLVPYCYFKKEKNRFNLFVFSLAGVSRSVTIAAAYIISVTGLSVAEALQAVRSSRTIANPNFGFQKQLYDFEVNGGAQKVSKASSSTL